MSVIILITNNRFVIDVRDGWGFIRSIAEPIDSGIILGSANGCSRCLLHCSNVPTSQK